LTSTTSDLPGHHNLDLGGSSLASLVLVFLATTHDPLGCSPHVDRHFPFPLFWL
jgi:hypothetical protein